LGAWWATHTSIFDARSISVGGNRRLDRATVLRQAGVGPATNLVWFSPGDVEERLERNPWILSAKVTRALPSSLSITIAERSPIAVVVAGDRAYLVAGDRTILGVAGVQVSLPRIDGPASGLTIGATLPAPTPGLTVLQAMPSSLRSDVKGVGPDRNGLLIVAFKDGSQAIYGDATDAAAKARAVEALLQYAAKHHIAPKRLDVRTPDHPALLPAGGEVAPAA
jgi:cell division protein FtsQ